MANRMYVFDVDGVITDPNDSNRVNVGVLHHISGDLKDGIAVAFNTGRSHKWVEETIIGEMKKLCPPRALEHLLVVAEMGGEVCVFVDGQLRIELDPDLSLPEAFR